jgi:hypothetical protein
MALEIMNPAETTNGNGIGDAKDTLYVLGGVAMVIIGAGLVLTNPTVRKYLGRVGIGDFATTALPDIEKYFRLRSM